MLDPDFSSCLINCSKFSGRPSLNLKIGKYWQDVLLDTGANINVIDKSLIDKNALKHLLKDGLKVTCANGEGLSVIGKIYVYIKIYENNKKIEFYVVDKVKPKVIAGMPFLKAFDIYLSFHKSLLEFNTQSVYLYDIKNLLNDYKVIFMKDSGDIGKTDLIKHEIRTKDGPIQINPRRQPVHLQEKIDKNIEELLKIGVIKECESPWNSPIVCVKKKNTDDIRMCLDFRRLNEITERPVFPIPNVEEILDSLGNAKYFSTIDLGSAYYQVELDESSKLKTAFSTRTQQF